MTKDELLKTVQEAPLPSEVKAEWVERIGSEEISPELITALMSVIQTTIEANFAEDGVVLDEESADYKKAEKKMIKELETAGKKYDKEMTAVEKEGAKLEKQAKKEFDKLEADVAKAVVEQASE